MEVISKQPVCFSTQGRNLTTKNEEKLNFDYRFILAIKGRIVCYNLSINSVWHNLILFMEPKFLEIVLIYILCGFLVLGNH